MLFANNADLQKQLFAGNDNLIAKLLKVPSLEQRADLAVRAVLSRPALANERKVLTEYLRRREDRAGRGMPAGGVGAVDERGVSIQSLMCVRVARLRVSGSAWRAANPQAR